MDSLATLRDTLRAAGFDFVITRVDGAIAHVNIYVEEEKCTQ